MEQELIATGKQFKSQGILTLVHPRFKQLLAGFILLVHVGVFVIAYNNNIKEYGGPGDEFISMVNIADNPIIEQSQAIPEPELSPAFQDTESVSMQTTKSRPRAYQGDGDYFPQTKVTKVPEFPAEQILANIVYPALAAKQGLEATVVLELRISRKGIIQRITVLKDPGFGFADAAVKALDGVVVAPAEIEGEAVPVAYRYAIRFKLK
jgi:protein TonB